MSEGTAVAYVSRWAINDAGTGVLQVAAGLSGVRCTYRPRNNEDYVGDNGRIEAIYWGNTKGDVQVRAFKGGSSIKYAEEMDRDLVLLVAGGTEADQAETVEERGANLLGEVIKVFQQGQPPSPGDHLPNVRAYIDGWTTDVGTLARGGAQVAAITFTITVRIQANVEQ